MMTISGGSEAHTARVAPGSPTHKENEMLSSSHVSALQTKHAGLEAQLRDEMNRPAPDTATIQHLKRQKLKIKEELNAI